MQGSNTEKPPAPTRGVICRPTLRGKAPLSAGKKAPTALPRRLCPMDASVDSESSNLADITSGGSSSTQSPLPSNIALTRNLFKLVPGQSPPPTSIEIAAAAAGGGSNTQGWKSEQLSLLMREEHAKRRRQLTSAETVGSCASSLTPSFNPHERQLTAAAGHGSISKETDEIREAEEDEVLFTDVPNTTMESAQGTAVSGTQGMSASNYNFSTIPRSATTDSMEELVLANHMLTDELLREWTGWEDLHLVLTAEFRIDAERMLGVDQMSLMLPRLTSLRISYSRVPQVRLLGVRYMNLKHLWLNNCQMQDLRGIGACAPKLKELYIAFNYIKDLTPLLDLAETLEVLDVEANELKDMEKLGNVLPAFHKLTSLTLQGNPAEMQDSVFDFLAARRSGADDASKEAFKKEDSEVDRSNHLSRVIALREWVHVMLPDLAYLDDIPLGPVSDAETDTEATRLTSLRIKSEVDEEDDRAAAAGAESLRDHRQRPGTSKARLRSAYVDPTDAALTEELRLVQECIRDCVFDTLDETMEELHSGLYSRPSTSCQGARPHVAGSSRTGLVTSGLRLGTSPVVVAAQRAGRLGSGLATPCSATLRSESLTVKPTSFATASAAVEASSLTTGGVFAGSAIASLRKRLSSPPVSIPVTPASPDCLISVSDVTPRCSRSREQDEVEPGVAAVMASVRRKMVLDSDEDADALLFDDEEEDEWERLKASLREQHLSSFLRRIEGERPLSVQLDQRQQREQPMQKQASTVDAFAMTAGLTPCGSRETPRRQSACGSNSQTQYGSSAVASKLVLSTSRRYSSSSGGATPSMASLMPPRPSTSQQSDRMDRLRSRGYLSSGDDDDVEFDTLVKRETGRSRLQIARAGIGLQGGRVGIGSDEEGSGNFVNSNFLENRDRFAVVEITDLSSEVL